jgi:predicted murein hydrolase (TIGR00659 family)
MNRPDGILIWVSATVLCYFLALRLYQKTGWLILHPVLISILSIMVLLRLTGVEYQAYMEGGSIVSFFLGPAVVALGVLLYEHGDMIRRNGPALAISMLGGSATGILSACGVAWAMGASDDILLSLSPKSVTTPIAIGIIRITGGIESLTAGIVIAVGIFGAAFGPLLVRALGIRGPEAAGLAIGAAAHGIGTARAIEEGARCGAASALAMCLNGIITAILAPWLVKIFL